MRESQCRRVLLVVAMAVVAFVVEPRLVYAQLVEITPKHLEEVGLRLPSYQSTIRDLMHYQDVLLSTHQKLRVQWNSIPGVEGTVPFEQVKGVQLSPDFILIDQKRGIVGPPGKCDLELTDFVLVVAGVTLTNEVRGLHIYPDPRIIRGESLHDGKLQFEMVITPKVTFDVYLPDDPQIRTVLFFKPHFSDATYHLERVGMLELTAQPQRPTRPK